MNTPRETRGPLKDNEYRQVQLGRHGIASISEKSTLFFQKGALEREVYILADDAIEAAKAILVAYNVPFCNRVTEK
jgi:hypothetical protein